MVGGNSLMRLYRNAELVVMYYQAVGLLPKDTTETPSGDFFKPPINYEAKDFSQASK